MKRLTVIAGHYGSGKTKIAVSLSLKIKEEAGSCVIGDLDTVNPYFRTKDAEKLLTENGVRLVSTVFANSNVDIPAIPAEMYSLFDDRSVSAVVDLGGDDMGAAAIGRFSEKIKDENDYDFLFVVNFRRPLTQTAADAAAIMDEIECAASLKFTGIINNTNLGAETTEEIISGSFTKAKELSELTNLPVVYTSADIKFCESLGEKAEKLLPLIINE